jgi:hypothetical protein
LWENGIIVSEELILLEKVAFYKNQIYKKASTAWKRHLASKLTSQGVSTSGISNAVIDTGRQLKNLPSKYDKFKSTKLGRLGALNDTHRSQLISKWGERLKQRAKGA